VSTRTAERIDPQTLEWLTEPDNPAVAVLTRTVLLGEKRTPAMDELWARRNEYAPVATILDAMNADGSWLPPERDYKKYEGNLWQIHFLGELWASGDDERVQRAAEYAFSRQLDDGSWSCNGRPSAAIPCLTANVGRALARLGFAADERVVAALAQIAALRTELDYLGCPGVHDYTLNGYCHMVAPKVLHFLAAVPKEAWPRGAVALRDECIRVLRDKSIYRSHPADYREYADTAARLPKAQIAEGRERFIAEHEPLEYTEKKGWKRLGYPLSYNSDALDSLRALAGVGETWRKEYEPALQVVEDSADASGRWPLKNTFNGKMLADVEVKGEPSKWLTFQALQVIGTFERPA
jgi:hypothetical protein